MVSEQRLQEYSKVPVPLSDVHTFPLINLYGLCLFEAKCFYRSDLKRSKMKNYYGITMFWGALIY